MAHPAKLATVFPDTSPVDIPTGTFAWFQDPGGNMLGLWENKR